MSKKHSLLKAGSVMFAGSMAANIANYLFQITMGRWLSLTDYGTMNSLFSLFMIVSVPGLTITLVVAKYTSSFKAKNQMEKVSGIYYQFLKILLMALVVASVIYFLLSPAICSFLKISSVTPVYLVGICLFFAFLSPMNLGLLQGLQIFGFLSFSLGMASAIKLFLSALLVYLGYRVTGVMTALALTGLIYFLATFFFLRKNDHLKSWSKTDVSELANLGEIIKYTIPVMAATVIMSLISQVDMVLVKHYFSAEQTGIYASVAVLGRAVLYLPAAIVVALFPMVSELHSLNQDSFHVLNKGLFYTGLLAGLSVMLFWLWPDFILETLFGSKFAAAAPLLGVFGIAMFPMAMLGIIINFNLARHQVKFIYPLFAGGIIQISLIILFHQSLRQILWIISGVGGGLLVTLLVMLAREKKMQNSDILAETGN